MNNYILDKIILASGSPRRRELLSTIAKEVLLMPQNVEEVTDSVEPHDIVKSLSVRKLGELPREFADTVIISGDTIVWHNGKQLGKPKDRAEAVAMLSELSGRTHQVYSGFAIAYRGAIITDCDVADVTFKELATVDIESYIDNHMPYDKAGAYGLQDNQVVDTYNGDANTVIGLPLARVIKSLEDIIS